MTVARPFIKWVGGKTQLLPSLLGAFPSKMGTYYEPFLGGGAVFFGLASENRFQRAVLNDWNKELIDCYQVVRDFPEELLAALQVREDGYNDYPSAKAFFERWKEQDPKELDPVTRASRTILLNKTGFNGLFRTNSRGIFNVPWGKKPKARIFDEFNIRACSAVLDQFVQFRTGDFTQAVEGVTTDDFVYFDPPYVPVSKSANFTSYTEGRFTIDDQYRLAALFKDLVAKGVKVALSNADVPEVRAMYSDFEMIQVSARRAVNSKGDRRGPVGEVIILGRKNVACCALPKWL